MIVNIWSDASFSCSYCKSPVNRKTVSACGYIINIGKKELKHEVNLVANLNNNTEAEVYAATLSLWEAFGIPDLEIVNIHVDCMLTYRILSGKIEVDPLIHSSIFYDLKETVSAYSESGIRLVAVKIKAHYNNLRNNKIDQSVRTELRNHIRNKK